MQRCVELSRLPKLKGPLKAIKFRRATPGTPAPVLHLGTPPTASGPLDPTHPASRLSRYDLQRSLPSFRTKHFSIRAVPKQALYRPDTVWPDPPYEINGPRIGGRGKGKAGEGQLTMSIVFWGGKVIKWASARRRLKARVRDAIGLIVTRGADKGVDEKGREIVVFDEEKAKRSLVLENWTYVILPSPYVHSLPHPQLISELRLALNAIRKSATALTTRWNQLQSSSQPFSPSKSRAPLQQARITPSKGRKPYTFQGPSAAAAARLKLGATEPRERKEKEEEKRKERERMEEMWKEVFDMEAMELGKVLEGGASGREGVGLEDEIGMVKSPEDEWEDVLKEARSGELGGESESPKNHSQPQTQPKIAPSFFDTLPDLHFPKTPNREGIFPKDASSSLSEDDGDDEQFAPLLRSVSKLTGSKPRTSSLQKAFEAAEMRRATPKEKLFRHRTFTPTPGREFGKGKGKGGGFGGGTKPRPGA